MSVLSLVSNPFQSLDEACTRVLEHLFPENNRTEIVMDLSYDEQELLKSGWVRGLNDWWRHPDAPLDESMSLFFAKKVQRKIAQYDMRKDQEWRKDYTSYRMAVSSVHFDTFTD